MDYLAVTCAVTYRDTNGAPLPLVTTASAPAYAAETLELEVQALRLINAAQRKELQALRDELAKALATNAAGVRR